MAKILFTADWHIKLGQKNVPKAWQRDRFKLLVQELNKVYAEYNCDLHIIGGDILDRFSPTAEELEVYYDSISELAHRTIIFSGNHEMVTKTHSVLDNTAAETNRCNPLVRICSEWLGEFDMVDYSKIHKKFPYNNDICFTHVRGEIPPHVVPEIPLEVFDKYELVISGDLHSHQNTQESPAGTPIVYPGSPLTTSFHRKRTTKTNGCLIVDTDTNSYEWVELGHLPQLIRKTLTTKELDGMVEDDYDRVIYEVEGDLSELKEVKNSELLDKKINKNVGTEAVLDLSKVKTLEAELSMYFLEIEKLPKEVTATLVGKYKELIPDAD